MALITGEEWTTMEREIVESRIATALERIADALEMQVNDQHDQANFSRMLLKGLTPDDVDEADFEDYRMADDGTFRVLSGGVWREATLAEEQLIAEMTQKRKRR